MAKFPLPPGGQFPLTTAPTGRNAGGLFPNSQLLSDAILSLQPSAYWPLDDGSGPLRDVARGWSATLTNTPSFGVAGPSPIGRGLTWGTAYADAGTSVPAPSTSMSVMAIFQTTDATAAVRRFGGRGTGATASWDYNLDTSHRAQMTVLQSTGAAHCSAIVTGAANDGLRHLFVATFDGTTLFARRVNQNGALVTGSSTSLTGAWNKSAGAAFQLNARNSAGPFPGTSWHLTYWVDRVITQAETLYLASIAFGG